MGQAMVSLKEFESAESVNESRLRPGNIPARTDFFPKLVGLQRALGAKSFIVFRTTAAGFMNKRKLTLEIANLGTGSQEHISQISDSLTDILLDHLDRSILPVMWYDAEDGGIAHEPTVPSLLHVIDGSSLPFAGIAFPVRLGSTGNGIIMFCGQSLMLDNEIVLEQHVKACQIMVELVAIEERRSAPSETLSEREIACLQLAGDGRISEEIAVKLGLSVHTVNAYLGSATIKLNSVNRIQAIAKAIKLGYIH
jgi:DNA-binding CsgD family transcriptional regulator